jgi:uncharacterized phage protein (TIGR01671 family)
MNPLIPKYRVWAVDFFDRKAMVPVVQLIWEDEGLFFKAGTKELGYVSSCIVTADGKEYGEFQLMRQVNIKDKNGKELYAKDIVRWTPKYDAFQKNPEDYNGKEIFVVKDVPGVTWLEEEMFGYEGELLIPSGECELIGNIYENPELLK